MLLPEYCPVLDLKRGDVVDQRFFGIAALYDLSSGVPVEIKKTGNDNNHPFFLRSLLKPIQASIMADYNTAEFYGFSNAELAVMQASHAGETVHTELVLSILKKTGLNEKYLKCPAIFPLNPNILQPGENPKSMHNNCSAKHAMMLAVSKQLNFSLEDYTDVNHPLQKIILKKYASCLNIAVRHPEIFLACCLKNRPGVLTGVLFLSGRFLFKILQMHF